LGVGCVTLGSGTTPAAPLDVNFNFREGWARLEGYLFHYFMGKVSLCGQFKDAGPYFTEMPERRPCKICLREVRKADQDLDTRVSEVIDSRAKEVVLDEYRNR
jgi:hypothetical protein